MQFALTLCVCIQLGLYVLAVRYPEGGNAGHNNKGGRGGGKGGGTSITYQVTVVKGGGGGGQSNKEPLFNAAKNIGLNKFCDYMEQAGLQDMLNEPGPYTIFAPSDEAFGRLPGESFGQVTGNKDRLREVMQYHCVKGNFDANQLQQQSGAFLNSNNDGYNIRVEKYGDLVTVNGCPVTTYDQGASNGVIHVLDGVMYPLPTGDIGKTLETTPSFGQLLGMLKKTNVMDEYLKGDKPYTFLAPTDAAFSKVNPATMSWLNQNPEKIKELMQQHIVRGVYYTSCLGGGVQDLPTVAQGNIKLQKNQDGYLFNDVVVERPDISCTNGVVHAINQVLIPSGFGPVNGGPMTYDVRYPSDVELDKIREHGKGGYGAPGKPNGDLETGSIGGPGPYGGSGVPAGGKPYTGLGRPAGGVPNGPVGKPGSIGGGGPSGGPGPYGDGGFGGKPVVGGPNGGSGPYGDGGLGGKPVGGGPSGGPGPYGDGGLGGKPVGGGPSGGPGPYGDGGLGGKPVGDLPNGPGPYGQGGKQQGGGSDCNCDEGKPLDGGKPHHESQEQKVPEIVSSYRK